MQTRPHLSVEKVRTLGGAIFTYVMMNASFVKEVKDHNSRWRLVLLEKEPVKVRKPLCPELHAITRITLFSGMLR